MIKKKGDGEIVLYSEGEEASEFVVNITDLKPQARLHRVMFLWRRCYIRAKAANQLIDVFNHIHKHVILFGTTKNLLAEKAQEA